MTATRGADPCVIDAEGRRPHVPHGRARPRDRCPHVERQFRAGVPALRSAAGRCVRSAGVGSARATIDQTAASVGRLPTSRPAALARLPSATAAIVRGARDLTRVAAVWRVARAAAPVGSPSTAELRDRAGAAFEVTAAPIAQDAAVVCEPLAGCWRARTGVGGPLALALAAACRRTRARPAVDQASAAVAVQAAVNVRAGQRDAEVVVTGDRRTPAAKASPATTAERRGRACAALDDGAAFVGDGAAGPRRQVCAGQRGAPRAAEPYRNRHRGRRRAACRPRHEALGRRGAQLDWGDPETLARTGAQLTVGRHVDEGAADQAAGAVCRAGAPPWNDAGVRGVLRGNRGVGRRFFDRKVRRDHDRVRSRASGAARHGNNGQHGNRAPRPRHDQTVAPGDVPMRDPKVLARMATR
jgi:hypothetical protein